MKRAFAVGVLLLATCVVQAQDDDPAARAEQEKQTRVELTRIRTEIAELADQQRATSGEHAEAMRALREQERAIDAALKGVRELDERLVGQQAELDALEVRRSALAKTLETQRESLAVLLRSAYALGRSEELKLLLQQEDVGAIARVLAYHRYFQRARVERIDTLLDDLRQLADVQQAIVAQNTELTASRTQREADLADLQQQRAEREHLLGELDGVLKDQQARLAAMGRNEKGLLELIEKLRDVFADIPKQLTGAEPFASLRGKMAWPAPGKLRTGFGGKDESGRTSNGLQIAAESGTPVKAVARGRVAYADWLTGYGMLLIVDHGDGYMTLYGYNESLLKEVGDWVAPGEAIAQSGASGGQRSPSVYFELRRQGKPVDPKPWLR